MLEDLDAHSPLSQRTDSKSCERAVGIEVGAQQNARGADIAVRQRITEYRRRHVYDRDRVAYQRQRRAHAREIRRLTRDGELADPPS